MTLYTNFPSSQALKDAGVELPIEVGDRVFVPFLDKQIPTVITGSDFVAEGKTRRYTLDELMQMPEYREIDIVMFNSGSAGFRVEWLAYHKRVGELYPDLQSALNKVASLIAQHKKG